MAWDRTLRDCQLETVLNALYGEEINCGVSSFFDEGWRAWIGDDMNGRKAEALFQPKDLHRIPAWLADNAERLFPDVITTHSRR